MPLRSRHWSCFIFMVALTMCATLASAQEKVAEEWTLQEEQWYTLDLADARMGWMHTRVFDNGSQYRTETTTKMAIKRGDVTIEIAMESTFIETHEGKPILMSSLQDMSLQTIEQEWRFKDDKVLMISKQGGREKIKTFPRPEGEWLTPMAVQRFLADQIEQGKSTITYAMLSPEQGLTPVDVTMKYVGDNLLELEIGTLPVTEWESVTSIIPLAAKEMFDSEGNSVFSEITMPGFGTMTTRLSSEEIAWGKKKDIAFEAPELMFNFFIKPTPSIENPYLAQTARMRIRPKEGTLPELPSAGAQRVENDPESDGFIITVDINDNLPASAEDKANEAYLEATTVVDAKDSLVQKLARRAVRGAGDDPYEKAEALRAFVNKHISKKGLATAFASASETARMRTGDCSEHGVLLTAMLRAQGIPARVATGLVYVESFVGQDDIFGWHMWTQALIHGTWVDFDATLPVRYNAAHVLTSTSALADGLATDDMSTLFLLMGNIEIDVLEVGYEVKSLSPKTNGNHTDEMDN